MEVTEHFPQLSRFSHVDTCRALTLLCRGWHCCVPCVGTAISRAPATKITLADALHSRATRTTAFMVMATQTILKAQSIQCLPNIRIDAGDAVQDAEKESHSKDPPLAG